MGNVICKATEKIPALVDGRPGHGKALVWRRNENLWYPSDPPEPVTIYNFNSVPIAPDGEFVQCKDVDGALVVDHIRPVVFDLEAMIQDA